MLLHFQEIPWSADATARGWFGVKLEEEYDGSKGWVWKICKLSDPLLKSHCPEDANSGGYVSFTPKGVLVGVTNTEPHLKISKHDLNAYGGKPLSVEIVKLPRH